MAKSFVAMIGGVVKDLHLDFNTKQKHAVTQIRGVIWNFRDLVKIYVRHLESGTIGMTTFLKKCCSIYKILNP